MATLRIQPVGVLAGAMLANIALAPPADAAKASGPAAKPAPAKPAAAATPPAPAAPPGEPAMFTVFRTVCAIHLGELSAAEADARKQGFVTVPPPADADPAEVARHTVLQRHTNELQLLIILTRAPDDILAGAPNGEATMCVVSGGDPDGAVAATAKAWVGLEPSSQDSNHTTFLYRQRPAQRLLLPDQADTTIQSAILAGEFRVFDVDQEGAALTLGLMTGLTRPPKP